jgi:hypothetical protein
MPTSTIGQAQDKGLLHQFDTLLGNLRAFAVELYATHGGWVNRRTGAQERGRASLMSLANQAEAYSPSLSIELRNLASRG